MNENTYAEKIRLSEVILAGFKNHREEFIEKGFIAEKYLDEFETLLRSTIDLNNDKDKAKARMIRATAQLHRNLDELRRRKQTLKRIVTNHVPTPQWRELGMIYRPRGPKPKNNPVDNQDGENQIDDSQDDLLKPAFSEAEVKKENKVDTVPDNFS